jgi:hypothetical protein
MVSPRVAATPLPGASATPSDDFAAWRELVSVPLDEQSVRLHHRLTWIHPFPRATAARRACWSTASCSNSALTPSRGGAVCRLPDAPEKHRSGSQGGRRRFTELLAFVRT